MCIRDRGGALVPPPSVGCSANRVTVHALAKACGSHVARCMSRSLVVTALALAGCGSVDDGSAPDPSDDPSNSGFEDGKADGVPSAEWTSVGLGVAYQQVNTGHAVLIAYGGYSAMLSYSAGWATELVDARLGAANVGHIYAVKGPVDPSYSAREIANTKLAAHLATIDDGVSPIYVVAHSSGTYVAHELLGQLQRAGKASVLGRISYANLDGGGAGLSDTIVASLDKIEFVFAHDPTLGSGYSQNTSTARALAADYTSDGAFEVRVPGTGCNSGAGWCMHDVLITHQPHNPNTYDLSRDYTDFANRPVTTAVSYTHLTLPTKRIV